MLYTALYFANDCKLPWENDLSMSIKVGAKENEAFLMSVYEAKLNLSREQFATLTCKNLVSLIKMAQKLRFNEEPPYADITFKLQHIDKHLDFKDIDSVEQ